MFNSGLLRSMVASALKAGAAFFWTSERTALEPTAFDNPTGYRVGVEACGSLRDHRDLLR